MQLIERSKTGQPENKQIGKMIICILHEIHVSINSFNKKSGKIKIKKLIKNLCKKTLNRNINNKRAILSTG